MVSSGALIVFCCICLVAYQRVCNAVSFKNADFESTNYNGSWTALSCSLSPSNDAYSGSHSVHVSKRHHNWASVSQNVGLLGNKVYKIIIYVKLLNVAHHAMYQNVALIASCKNKRGRNVHISFGHTPHVQGGQWHAVGGVNKIPAGDHNCRVYVQTAVPTEYLADHAILQEVTLASDWKTAANQRIENLRKADLTVHLAGTVNGNSTVDIELTQQQHEFAFGSAVNATLIVDSSHHAYQQAFYDTFEWAVLGNALKWYATEPRKGVFHYNKSMNAINALRSHGVIVRGHNVFWAVDKYVQDWVKALNKTQLTTEMQAHIQRVIGHTKGLLEHWDVNNENLHGNYYTKTTGNPNMTMDMFRKVHALDSHPKLFLNEYNVLSQCEMAVALMDLAKRYKDTGVPIGGIGVQGHLKQINLAEILERLNILGEAGLPVVITELGINDQNENSKANKLENLLTMFFSHPSVEGVIFWGFWDGSIWEKDAVLFTGSNVTANAAGRKLQTLLKTQWRSHKTATIHGDQPWHARVFKGAYKMTVKHKGHVINTEYFSVSSRGQILRIHLAGQQNGHPQISHIIVG